MCDNKTMQQYGFVTNLSSHTLTPYELSYLQKGLNYCSTPSEPNMLSLYKDLQRFTKSLRIAAHFHEHKNNHENPTQPTITQALEPRPPSPILNFEWKFKTPSNWNPPTNDKVLEGFISAVNNEFLLTNPKRPHNHNLKPEEYKARNGLLNNPNIIIKKADKGSSVVVMDKLDYHQECLRQLNDPLHTHN